MGKSSIDFLQKLERRARERQEEFIKNIAHRLGRKPISPPSPHLFKGAPEYWSQREIPEDKRIEMFIENWDKVGGEAQLVSDLAEARMAVREIIEKLEAQSIICHDVSTLHDLRLHENLEAEITFWDAANPQKMKEVAANADIGLIMADYAVAHTGSVVTISSREKGRIVSLLPRTIVILVPAQVIKTKLGDVMQEIGKRSIKAMPAGIHFISGPSRSADIENDLTIGVHGPGMVYAIIVK